MRRLVSLSAVAFGAMLAGIVASKLSSEAMAVIGGVICGVVASIPASIMILIMTRRLTTPTQSTAISPAPHKSAYPPVVVIHTDRQPVRSQFDPPWNAPLANEQPTERSFTVVGEEDWVD